MKFSKIDRLRHAADGSLRTVGILVSFIFAISMPGIASAQDGREFDQSIRQLMKRENVHGLAFALIENGQPSMVKAFGYRNVAKDLPLTTDTVMYGASLTKTAFAYMVMQLVDEEKLTLDAPITELLPRPLPDYEDYVELSGDDRWRLLTPRILLSHTTGFANFRWLEPDKKLRFHHRPGTRYGYSGEGFYVMQLILEQGLGLDVGDEMEKRVFQRFGMKTTSMTWRDDFANNLADGYQADGTMQPHDDRSIASAAGSMDTTINDQSLFWSGVLRGEGLTEKALAEMKRPQIAIASKNQFPTLSEVVSTENMSIQLSASLGWVTFQDTSGQAWFKGGHNDSTGNMVVCFEKGLRCVVLLSNDVRAEKIYPEIVEMLIGKNLVPWAWESDWFPSR
jgi:CubicO group peptidase (beta-lactamase class C family)